MSQIANAPQNIADVKQQLDRLKGFMTACPHADLLTDLNAQANELSKIAWGVAKNDMSQLSAAQEVQALVNEMTAPRKGSAGVKPVRSGPAGLGDAVKVTDALTVKSYLSKLTWDGQPRLSNPVYLRTILGADKDITGDTVKNFFVGAIARLFNPGSPVKALVLGGKRDNVDPLSTALMPRGAGEVYAVAARNIKPERCTFLTVIDGQGKPDKADVFTRDHDTFRRPRTEKEVTEARWFSLIVRAGNPGGDFIPVSTAPDLKLLAADNEMLWAEAYDAFYASTQSGKAQAAPAAVQQNGNGKGKQDKAQAAR